MHTTKVMTLSARSKSKGFTLIEIMIVVAILAILTVSLFLSMSHQRDKAEDARVKAYLNRLKIAFEDYYNDKNCYPPLTWFDGPEDCNSDNLRPYLGNIQCAKKTGLPYTYETDPTGCKSFIVLSNLVTESGNFTDSLGNPYTYCIHSTDIECSIMVSTPTSSPTPTPSPSPTPTPSPQLQYYCQAVGNCASFNTIIWDCIPSYADSLCTTSNNCSTTGSCSRR